MALQEAVFRLKSQDSINLADRGRFRRWLYLAVTHRYFDYGVFVLIIVNCGILSCWHYGQTQAFEAALNRANIFFTTVFAAELAIRIIALGPQMFW